MAHPCERVLVVDDDADTREAITMLLESEGIDVVAAEGAVALNALREGYVPNVVVLDLIMPQVSGRTFRARMKLDPRLRDIPVVLCTGSPQLARDEDGFAAVIAKPFDPDAFFEALAALCMKSPRQRAS
jgi:twitching motility two-component system response regulator PilH